MLCCRNRSQDESMTRLDIKLELPDNLAKQAKEAGLLEPKALQILLREEVRRRRIARITAGRSNVAIAGIAPISMEEIQAEIEADRVERRNR